MSDIYDDYQDLDRGIGDTPVPVVEDGDSWENLLPPPEGFPERPTHSQDPNIKSPVWGESIGFTVPRPVVVVPGILGTSLERTERVVVNGLEKVRATSTVWPPVNPASQAANSLKELSRVDVRPRMDSNNPFVQGAYDGLVAFLTQQLGYKLGRDLFLFGYDWTDENYVSGKKLTGYINRVVERTGSGKVDVICHSMGGIVTRSAIRLSGAPVNRTIYLASPHYGAPKAYFALKKGVEHVFWLKEWIGRQVISQVSTVLGEENANKVIQDLAANMPSAYDLLPDELYFQRQKYICEIEDYGFNTLVEGVDETYTNNTYSRLDSDGQQAEVRRGLAFKSSLGSGLPGKHAVIASNTHSTSDHMVVFPGWIWGTYGSAPRNGAQDQNGTTITLPNGDGTVPLVSARGPGAFTEVVGEHTVMPNLADTHTAIALYLSSTT